MQGKCAFCGSWEPHNILEHFGACTNQYVGKRSTEKNNELDVLLLQGRRGGEGASIIVGRNFGCVHFHSKEKISKDEIKEKPQITPDDLRQIMKRKDMSQAELARHLNVTPQRVSDWLSNRRRRKIPSMASAALEAMGWL
jgi:DNA-binding transcriptional regulator YiaG